jgi:hypothetical protein
MEARTSFLAFLMLIDAVFLTLERSFGTGDITLSLLS